MVIGVIAIGILIFALMILGDHISDRCVDSFGVSTFSVGAFIGSCITILVVIEICLVSDIIGNPTPSALDVYRGNTELEITSVNGIPTDTVVVFKTN